MGIDHCRQRLRPIMGGWLVLWVFIRPAHWPFPDFGTGDRMFWWNILNRVVWAVVLAGASIVVDLLVVEWSKRRGIGRQSAQSPPHCFWSVLGAALLARTCVGFAFAGRPLPDGSAEFYAAVRYCDIVSITLLPVVIWLARRVGPPSQWSFVQKMRLQPPD